MTDVQKIEKGVNPMSPVHHKVEIDLNALELQASETAATGLANGP